MIEKQEVRSVGVNTAICQLLQETVSLDLAMLPITGSSFYVEVCSLNEQKNYRYCDQSTVDEIKWNLRFEPVIYCFCITAMGKHFNQKH